MNRRMNAYFNETAGFVQLEPGLTFPFDHLCNFNPAAFKRARSDA
jgi:hypothetical protein